MEHNMPSRPRLSFAQDTWMLHKTSNVDKELLLELRIKYGYNGPGKNWSEYQFFVRNEGCEFRIVTDEEWHAHVEDIMENEGDEAASIWMRNHEWTCPKIDSYYAEVLSEFQALVLHWEAMLQLGLFTPTSTMTPFK